LLLATGSSLLAAGKTLIKKICLEADFGFWGDKKP
jgi:hypothetical protein